MKLAINQIVGALKTDHRYQALAWGNITSVDKNGFIRRVSQDTQRYRKFGRRDQKAPAIPRSVLSERDSSRD